MNIIHTKSTNSTLKVRKYTKSMLFCILFLPNATFLLYLGRTIETGLSLLFCKTWISISNYSIWTISSKTTLVHVWCVPCTTWLVVHWVKQIAIIFVWLRIAKVIFSCGNRFLDYWTLPIRRFTTTFTTLIANDFANRLLLIGKQSFECCESFSFINKNAKL